MAIVFTGGTISMKPDAAAGGAVPSLSGQEIIARTPGLEKLADIVPVDWGLVPASHLNFGRLLELGRLLEETLEPEDVDGAVLVQGTDTIEETAFAFDLLLRSDKPLVVTGAMRNAAQPDYDGPRNLRDAVRCAAAPELRGQGTTVVLNGLVIAADQAQKAHTSALDAFRSRDGRPLGEVSDEGLRLVARREGRARLPVVPSAPVEDVHLITVTTGMDDTLLRLLRSTAPAGVVVAATGAGNTHPDILGAAVEMMAEDTVVCLTTRCPAGGVEPAYAFPGGGAQWQRAGAILSPLDGPKCRVALALGLAAGLDAAELRWILRA
ncbi:MAG TPA: asparaginase [Candidatus Limnocylindria bacterium]|nr:asparaginase [Candidatus Limnocylindria bacterium]